MNEGEARDRIDALRTQLEGADRAIVEALSLRQRLVETMAAVKQQSAAALRDRARESDVLQRVETAAKKAGLDPYFVSRLFREIIDHSVRSQQARLLDGDAPAASPIVVGYTGTEGAYGHQAALRHFSPRHADATYRAFKSFRDMLHAVHARQVDFAVQPIENTTAGSITEAYDLLSSMNLALVGEELQPIDHVLIGTAPVGLDEIRRIYSHPQALAQCSEFLARLPECTAEPFGNTALAVEKINADGRRDQAAIASEEVARRLNLPVLARDISNERINITRFVIVAAEPMSVDARIPCKTSIVFVTRHEQGALLACLNVLAERNLNLTKLESRPRQGSPWEYQFYVDFEGNSADPVVEDALRELSARSLFVKVFGSYPARTPATSRIERIPARAVRQPSC